MKRNKTLENLIVPMGSGLGICAAEDPTIMMQMLFTVAARVEPDDKFWTIVDSKISQLSYSQLSEFREFMRTFLERVG